MTSFSRIFIAAIAASLPAVAFPQTAPPQPTNVPPAPIGHRQPTAQDVPADDSVLGRKRGVGKSTGYDSMTPSQRAENERVKRIMGSICTNC